MRTSKSRGIVAIAATVAVVLGCTSWAPAQTPVEFTIDQSQSSLSLAATTLDGAVTLQEQPGKPGSLTTSYQGSISTLVSPGSSIQFVSAAANADVSGVYQPAVGGGSGEADGDYGGYASETILFVFTEVYAAVRDFVLNMNSGVLPLTGSNYDASQVTLGPSAGSMDWRSTGLFTDSGNETLVGESDLNQDTGGILSVAGVNLTLTVPIDFSMSLELLNPDDTDVHITGTIVATGVIPEPASLLLVLGGAGLLMASRRWRLV